MSPPFERARCCSVRCPQRKKVRRQNSAEDSGHYNRRDLDMAPLARPNFGGHTAFHMPLVQLLTSILSSLRGRGEQWSRTF